MLNIEELIQKQKEAEEARLKFLDKQRKCGCDKCSQWDEYFGCHKCDEDSEDK